MIREDHIDYKEFMKRKELKRALQSKSKNPFAAPMQTTNEEVYKQLYKFNPERELNEYTFNQQQEINQIPQQELEQSDDQIQEEDEQYEQVTYTSAVKQLFKDKVQVSKIQKANYVDAAVYNEHLRPMRSGEDAIKFFAKYGNTTPIKFVNCISRVAEMELKYENYLKKAKDGARNTEAPFEFNKAKEQFRPYDLIVISTSENQKELTLKEYYTISAHGIVHAYTDKTKKKMIGDSSTEVISLSDWMHESTMFNIITNIQFYKNYAIAKIFNIWKSNVRYNIFCKTRHRLVHEGFISKPAFANHLMDINQMMYELQLAKTLSNNIQQANKTWEADDFFKGDQKKARADASRHYDTVIEKVVIKIDNVCKEVIDRTNQSNVQESEEARFGQQVKQKPMNEVRKEAEENAYLLQLAEKDKNRLGLFIKLIDYLTVENLVQINEVSMATLLDEMKKERKNGLFNTTVNFDAQIFNPDEKEISEHLASLLDDMIVVMRNTVRIMTHPTMEPYTKTIKLDSIADMQKIIVNSVEYVQVRKEIFEKVTSDFEAAEVHVNQNYMKCRPIYDWLATWNQTEFEKADHGLDVIKQHVMELRKWLDDINRYIKDIPKGILNVDGKKIKLKLQPQVQGRLDNFKDYLYTLMQAKANHALTTLQTYVINLSKNPSNLKEYAEFIEAIQEAEQNLKPLENAKIEVEAMHSLLKQKFDMNPLTNQDIFKMDDIQAEYSKLIVKIKEADELSKEKKTEFIKRYEGEYGKFLQNIQNSTANVNKGKLILEDTPPAEALQQLNDIKVKQLDRFKDQDKNYIHYSKLMGISQSTNRDLQELEQTYLDRRLLWTHIEKFGKVSEDLYKNIFTTLNVEEIEKEMKSYELGVMKLKQSIQNLSKEGKDKVLDQHASRVANITSLMPIVQALGNKDIKAKHWKRIFEILGSTWQPGKTFTLNELLADGVMKEKESMEEISGRASGEAGIEAQLEEIKSKWGQLIFIVNHYREAKDKFIIGTLEDITAALDDHQLKVQTMLGTRFVAEIRQEVEVWERKLVLISDIIDEWLTCQRQWMYLENIFSADDIQKQLPQETAKFQQVDKFWKDIMSKTFKRPLVQDCCNSEDLLKKFQLNNKVLEDIQKGLENYLETKRTAFPRFYFLSNDELLEILSQTRNPHAVQAHLRKCFDNINRIKFSDIEDSLEIIAMVSAEPETQPEVVPFSNIVMAEGPVEHWLLKIQNMMIKSLYDITKRSLVEYPKDGLERDKWLFDYPAQPVLTIDLVVWTQGCTDAITKLKDGDKGALIQYNEFMKELINREVSLVRTDIDTLQRTLMCALIVLDVHARDVVGEMCASNVSSLNDFDWAKQLRYYWDADTDNCISRQTNAKFQYGYEYLGNGPRLVITPLTDKCYMTLTGALHLFFGGAPAGPAGTGKTETTKDLAKALAVQCVVFNCSDGLDFKTMGRFFSGLAQCGAWACFDEFNRIDIEVLSVIAQQILTIQQAIRQKVDQFDFEGRLIPLNRRFGVFITMNPGYAGRTELPDNLKALFRPVAMMIPNYALIAEIILFSEGFVGGRELARKMVNLYSLSSEQLSKQDHYDFGMRAVKSVLVMAGALRRKNATKPENEVLIKAMKDSNIPKFLEHDLPLFNGIIKDLFPDADMREEVDKQLVDAVSGQLRLQHFDTPAPYIRKICQLMETIQVRHGVMVVGLTGTGKTTLIHTLARAMEQMFKDGSTDYYHKLVQRQTLNPKAVTMNELFGYTNVVTNEWTDGIVASIVRTAVGDTTDQKKWIIFDGPVDALWIENMNTVLDDNKMLCLNNGQRIKLPATFTMMFEVQDLAVASPATVSRCGMVYMEPVHLGWEPLIKTWGYFMREQYRDRDDKIPPYVDLLIEKIETFFRDNLKVVREEFKETVPSTVNNSLKSLLNLAQINLKMCCEAVNLDKMNKFDMESHIAMVLIFSYIWSAGANLQDNSRQAFSQYLKGKIISLFSGFPFEGDVYDYYCDYAKKEFKPWNDLVTDFKYSSTQPYFNILVPTQDTVKFKYLLDKLIDGGFNVLMTGETGVGKSVIIQEYLFQLNQDKYVFSMLNFSAQTNSKNLLDLFMDKDKFMKKRRDLLGPPAGKKMVLFIDDVNMPALEKYGAQPPNELFRQIIDQGGFYDLKKLLLMFVKDCQFITGCAPPGGGRNAVSPRLFRHFNMIWCPELSQRSMETIFTAILKGFLLEQNKGLDKFAAYIVKSSVEIYLKITKELLPTPTKSHYTFNLRDLSKVFQGVLQIRYDNLHNKETLIQLWAHEAQRVFYDRLVDDKDRDWFLSLIVDHINRVFEFEWDKPQVQTQLFGDYSNANKEYLRIDNTNELPRKFNEYLGMYNSGQKPMNLVFFSDAIMHLSRLCRIIRQTRGNALLIGVGGSGRQSLTRLAAFTRGCYIFSIEISKSYREATWKDDLKKLLKMAGGKNQQVVFLFSDTQIVRESFLEDINNVLNTGEVPNIWAPEDLEEIINDIRPLAKEAGLLDSRDVLLKHFVYLVRENLHIVLAFSPVGEKLRNRCRQFPSIINCATIDWFDKWPDEALTSVAVKELGAQEHLGLSEFVDRLSQMTVVVHSDIKVYSERFYEELRRKNYVTPTSYLELLKVYIEMMKMQQSILPIKIKKYTVGLQTLKDTNEEVAKLQAKIIEFQPILDKAAIDNEKMMIELEGKSKQANETELVVSKEAAEAQKTKDQVNEMRDSCQAELDQALPILEGAKDAVKKIDKNMINEMKALKQPPSLVQIVMGAVCVLFGEKEDWPSAQKLLGRMTFIADLLDFQVEQVPERRLQKLKQTYLNNPDFTKEKIQQVSTAATTLLVWAVASEKYANVIKIVGPKKKALEEAEQSLKKVEQELAIKMGQLKEVQDMVSDLKRNLDNSIRKSEMLKQQQQTAQIQLVRAEKLVTGLASEAERWKVNVAALEEDYKNLIGNIIIAAGSIAYIGPFTYNYRQEIIQKWIQNCKELNIPVSDNFTLQRVLVEEVTIREWQEAGLPADNLSIDNGIFIHNCRRWPLIIDPQGQANKWIKALGKESNLQITKLSEANFLKTLENSIRFGSSVLLENVEEELDPSLEPILLKQLVKRGAQYILRIGDQDVPYSNDFRLYFTTKLPNPHYIPEIAIKTTIINFTVTPSGLEDQLLVEVVRHERIDLEEKRVNLILQISQDKKQLQDLEDKILKLISEAQGRILEEEDLITTLDASKITSDTVNQRMAQSKITAEEINKARESYRIVARRGSVIYFVIADLALIDPMYQYSLEFFIRLFKKRMEQAPNPPELQDRLIVLIDDLTKSFFINICRGLFEKDKLLFSFLIASKIQLQAAYIQPREWNIFLRGVNGVAQEEQMPDWLTDKVWKNCQMLSQASLTFQNFTASLQEPSEEPIWKEIMDAVDPWTCDLPLSIKGSVDTFQKLLLLKTLRDEKLVILIKNYVRETLGQFFIESPAFDLRGAFQDSSSTTPIIFVLSPGADPITYLLNLAKELEMDAKLKIISLGQGQGGIAKELIRTGRRTGDWVCLQNCHLAVTWMPTLEVIQELQVEADTDPNYRLWLTSMPSDKFPVPVLQSGIKLTNEPPKGLKANLSRTFNDVPENVYDSCSKKEEFQKLLFSLAFFHAVILERRKFGAIGWNIPYEWMNSDLETCQLQLMMYLDEQPDVPYQTLNYLIAEINYGGRVTDDKDVRLITDLLRQYFCPAVLNDPTYKFSSSGVYHPPQILDLSEVKSQINQFPLEDDPEVFGLHANANITFQQKTVSEFMVTLLSVQPRMVSDKGLEQTPDQIAFAMAKDIESRLPALLIQKKDISLQSLYIFRAQEVDRFNRLVKVMKNSLGQLQKAIQGLVVMSLELEKMFTSFIDSRVPENWENVAYPSLKPLGTWVTDLIERLKFFKQWLELGKMDSYWLSAMFFPQGFMTAAKQEYARLTQTPIDTLSFRTQVRMFFKDNVSEVPKDGVNIDGLFLQGCRWDMESQTLQESTPLQLFQDMPVIWIEPVLISQLQSSNLQYKCPMYKTSTRRGTLSTTGHSTNFVMYLDLKSGVDQEMWVRRGVALLCQLDD